MAASNFARDTIKTLGNIQLVCKIRLHVFICCIKMPLDEGSLCLFKFGEVFVIFRFRATKFELHPLGYLLRG